MENILVIGATGSTGTEVLKHLHNLNVQVFAGVRDEASHAKVNPYAQPVPLDFTKPETVHEACAGKDRIFLVTPLMQNPDEITALVVEAAKANGVRHIVRSSAAGADPNGSIIMARWAGASEAVLIDSGIPFTILRPHSFLQNFITASSYTIRTQDAYYLPLGNAHLAQLDLADLAEVAAIALTTEDHLGKIYELSGLTYTSVELAEILSDVMGRKISYIDTPEVDTRNALLSYQLPEWMVDSLMELYYIIKQGWTDTYTDDFKNITGKEYTSARTFFEKNREYFISEK
ncbi:SDR family oxidoreductase [Arundinibacter roseus]|uniref:SDR family oxidoreductase n=1 Tax=Arundinibacter roseus TaxID=2070510 RepID=A0A4R4KJA6_9BACT|nr:SDR family oxidoreductase [Arundinibacter roseus]TDB68013.1 SDR family oxidoreductase [Arundinibacter roseus]